MKLDKIWKIKGFCGFQSPFSPLHRILQLYPIPHAHRLTRCRPTGQQVLTAAYTFLQHAASTNVAAEKRNNMDSWINIGMNQRTQSPALQKNPENSSGDMVYRCVQYSRYHNMYQPKHPRLRWTKSQKRVALSKRSNRPAAKRVHDPAP